MKNRSAPLTLAAAVLRITPTKPATQPQDPGRVLAWLGLCLLLAWPLHSRSADAPLADQPLPERGADGAPMGVRIAPGLTLGGYGTVQLALPRHALASSGDHAGEGDGDHGGSSPREDPQYARRNRLTLSHLSAIAWWEPAPAIKLLAELDSQDVLQLPTHHDNDDGVGSAPTVALERLYLDFLASDELKLRIGKFLTPIGRWNQEHSDPLTWTTLRPLISQSAFPTSATGLMLFGSLPLGPQGLDYQLYASGGSDWHASPRVDPFSSAIGLRLAAALSADLQFGLSAAQYVQQHQDRDRFDLLGLDAVWAVQGTEISAEAIVRRSRDDRATERGGFVQGRWPLAMRWSAVARVEAYKRAEDTGSHRSALLGLVYRSGHHWVGKVEWVEPNRAASGLPQGLLASLTLMY